MKGSIKYKTEVLNALETISRIGVKLIKSPFKMPYMNTYEKYKSIEREVKLKENEKRRCMCLIRY